MLLAWASASLHAACRSGDALSARWPDDSDAAKLLLSAITHAQDLREVSELRSVTVTPPRTTTPEVGVSLEEVVLKALVLTPPGHHVEPVPPEQFWSRAAGATALMVLDMQARGLALVRTAS